MPAEWGLAEWGLAEWGLAAGWVALAGWAGEPAIS
jgi:hypothetical protein